MKEIFIQFFATTKSLLTSRANSWMMMSWRLPIFIVVAVDDFVVSRVRGRRGYCCFSTLSWILGNFMTRFQKECYRGRGLCNTITSLLLVARFFERRKTENAPLECFEILSYWKYWIFGTNLFFFFFWKTSKCDRCVRLMHCRHYLELLVAGFFRKCEDDQNA